jgi:hypothetical protein
VDYRRLAKKALKALSGLPDPSDQYYMSIAKALELRAEGRIRIVFRGLPHGVFTKMGPGLMLTQVITAKIPGRTDRCRIYEHFIYYDVDAHPTIAQFAIAHELAHILLHDPTRDRARDYIGLRDATREIFITKYTDAEEREADVVAAILHKQHSTPRCTRGLTPSCLWDLRELLQHDILKARLDRNLPKQFSCLR